MVPSTACAHFANARKVCVQAATRYHTKRRVRRAEGLTTSSSLRSASIFQPAQLKNLSSKAARAVSAMAL